MIVLGFDPGYGRLGFGVLSCNGPRVTMRAAGVITTPANTPTPNRLTEIARDVEALLDEYLPELVAIEEIFFAQSTTTALRVAEVRGLLLYLCAKRGIALIEVQPTQVKLALTGYGHADKRQMQQMIKTVLNLPSVPKPDDAADALAIAWTGMTVRQ